MSGTPQRKTSFGREIEHTKEISRGRQIWMIGLLVLLALLGWILR